MGNLLIPIAALLVAVVLAGLSLGGLTARRAMLTRRLGTFECSLRHETIRERSHWTAGIARYGHDRLDWYRFFAVGFRAAESLSRGRLVILDSRQPEGGDAHTVLPGWVVVRCAYGAVIVELAMSEGAYNGLAAWLESAPPGQHVNVA